MFRTTKDEQNEHEWTPRQKSKESVDSFLVFGFSWHWGLNSGPTPCTLSYSTSPFSEGFFEMSSHELFAQAGLEL
jgi:hypothetical protein